MATNGVELARVGLIAGWSGPDCKAPSSFRSQVEGLLCLACLEERERLYKPGRLDLSKFAFPPQLVHFQKAEQHLWAQESQTAKSLVST